MAKSTSPSPDNSPKNSGAGKKQAPPANESWRQRISSLFVSDNGSPPAKKRRISRKERDDKRKRWLYIALSVAGVATILLLSGAAMNEYFLKPRKVLASVGGEDITRRDYWKYQSHSLINQSLQYQQYAQLVQGQQQQQYLAMAQQAQAQLGDVWGSTQVDDATLSRMIDDKVFVRSLDTLGLSISGGEVSNYVDEQFANPSALISSPTPTPTLIPERAEWATQTAVASEALQGSPEAVPASPTAGSPEAAASTASASPEVPLASPGTGSPPAAGTPQPTATVSQEDARATSEANQANYEDDVLGQAHMSMSDYQRLVAEPALARDKVGAYFTNQLGQSAEQLHAAHILIGTRELADQLYRQIQQDPESFATLASESSVDEGTAANGGDLGWFPRGVMVEPFEEVAFDLPPGSISEPFQTEFGWHIVQVLERDPDRPLTDSQISQTSRSLVDRWLGDQKATADVSSSIKPTPTPSLSQFVPPAGAPPVPTPTALGSPVPLPEASPAGSPDPVTVASPEATPATE